MTQEELIRGYEKLVADQVAIIKGYAEIVSGYEKMQNTPAPSPVQDLLNKEIMLEHLKKNTPEPLEFDSLKLTDEERRKRFGARLKFFRKALGIKQNELASQLGITPQALAIYETGRREPNLKNLIALARALHTSTDSLLGEPTLSK